MAQPATMMGGTRHYSNQGPEHNEVFIVRAIIGIILLYSRYRTHFLAIGS